MSEMQTVCCKNGHVIGVMRRNSRGLRELLLYRQAIDPADEVSDPPDVIAVVDSAIEIKCSICETARAWVPGEAEMLAIVNRQRKHKKMRDPSPYSLQKGEGRIELKRKEAPVEI